MNLSGKGSFELNSMLGTWASGVGKCDLVKMEVVYVALSAAKIFKFGVCESGSGASLQALAMKENGIYCVSTTFSVGTRAVKEIIPESNMSKQIRPNSSNLMMMSVRYEIGTDFVVQIAFHLNVSTVRMHYLN